MNVEKPGLKFYMDKIKQNKPFSFMRYGNVEWDCILELWHQTRSRSQKFNPSLREALKASLTVKRKGDYFTAMQSTSFLQRTGILPKAESWLSVNAPDHTWYNGEVFTRAAIKGKLYPLIAALKQQRVVVVGPPWLMKLKFASVFMPVAKRNCWKDIDVIKAQLRNVKRSVVSFSAGPATKVLIHYLQPIIGNSCWLIDFGSLWDPYCGVNSRRYHGRMNPEKLAMNMKGKA